jgi:acetate kinase
MDVELADARMRPKRQASREDRRLVLVVNTGSSTVKGSVVAVPGSASRDVDRLIAQAASDPPAPIASVAYDWSGEGDLPLDAAAAVQEVLRTLRERGVENGQLAAVSHRVVHGGARSAAVQLDDGILAEIEGLTPLAPLHNPVAVAAIRAARSQLPAMPHVAVFDTAFHAGLPERAWRYPLPAAWNGWGIRRYGFHGLSVRWAVARTAALLRKPSSGLALVVAHLGSGCSVTAVLDDRSVATSMGMTPLEGLMMGTRAGSIDPGILLRVLRDGRRDRGDLEEDLATRAGLLGVSGRSARLQDLEAAAAGGDQAAALAIDMFVDRAAAGIAAIATSLPRLDGLVFSGGIGANAGAVRAAIVERLAVLGVAPVDPAASRSDRVLPPRAGRVASGPPVLRVEAREDIIAAAETIAALD